LKMNVGGVELKDCTIGGLIIGGQRGRLFAGGGRAVEKK